MYVGRGILIVLLVYRKEMMNREELFIVDKKIIRSFCPRSHFCKLPLVHRFFCANRSCRNRPIGLSKQNLSLRCLSLAPFSTSLTSLVGYLLLSNMSDKELIADDVLVKESRASTEETSNVVSQDEDACTPLPEG